VELPESSVQVIGLCISFALYTKYKGDMFIESNEEGIHIWIVAKERTCYLAISLFASGTSGFMYHLHDGPPNNDIPE
jgi:hypothetical protein